jgi:hypothetical protein
VTELIGRYLLDLQYGLPLSEAGPIQLFEIFHQASIEFFPQDPDRIGQARNFDQEMNGTIPGFHPIQRHLVKPEDSLNTGLPGREFSRNPAFQRALERLDKLSTLIQALQLSAPYQGMQFGFRIIQSLFTKLVCYISKFAWDEDQALFWRFIAPIIDISHFKPSRARFSSKTCKIGLSRKSNVGPSIVVNEGFRRFVTHLKARMHS